MDGKRHDPEKLKRRLAAWQPPAVDTSRKPRGLMGRRFTDAARAFPGGEFRPGYRGDGA